MTNLNKETIQGIEKFAVATGDTPNADRCIVLNVEVQQAYDVTMCINEDGTEIKICQINGKDIAKEDLLLMQLLVQKLEKSASKEVYTAKDESNYKFYMTTLKPNTDCEFCTNKCQNKL